MSLEVQCGAVAPAVYPSLMLSNGQTLAVQAVQLFDAAKVQEINFLRAAVAAKLGPTSTGLGFIGSPTWVIGASIGLGLLEAMKMKSNQGEAVKLLQELDAKSQALYVNSVYCDASKMHSNHVPSPDAWSFEETKDLRVHIGDMPWSARNDLFKRHHISKADVNDNHVIITERRRFVHNGNEFISLKTDFGHLQVRWSSVIAYMLTEG